MLLNEVDDAIRAAGGISASIDEKNASISSSAAFVLFASTTFVFVESVDAADVDDDGNNVEDFGDQALTNALSSQ